MKNKKGIIIGIVVIIIIIILYFNSAYYKRNKLIKKYKELTKFVTDSASLATSNSYLNSFDKMNNAEIKDLYSFTFDYKLKGQRVPAELENRILELEKKYNIL